MLNKKYIAIVACALAAGAGFLVWHYQTRDLLPTKLPPGLTVRHLYSTGGMTPREYFYQGETFLSVAKSYILRTTASGTEETPIDLTSDDLSSLYSVLKDTKFSKIKINEGTVYDGGTNIVRVEWGNTVIEKGQNGNGTVDEGSWKNFNSVTNAIDALVASKVRR